MESTLLNGLGTIFLVFVAAFSMLGVVAIGMGIGSRWRRHRESVKWRRRRPA